MEINNTLWLYFLHKKLTNRIVKQPGSNGFIIFYKKNLNELNIKFFRCIFYVFPGSIKIIWNEQRAFVENIVDLLIFDRTFFKECNLHPV